jgi:endonuclease/exonuclease/phosphatase family metal-dependent hydrolase
MTRLRVATYNVHKCKGVDWRVSPARIAEVICELGADLLAVQEVLYSQAHLIADELRVPFFFGRARQHTREPYGNAIFTRHSAQSSEEYDLTVRGREPRQCLRVSVTVTESRPVHFFAVHLGTSLLERREQARRFSVDILEPTESWGYRVVAGDFNEWTRGLATQTLSRYLRSADISLHLKRTRTYPGLLPFMHLDHIYYDPDFFLREMHLHRTRLSLLASDHLPLIADFETH